MKNIYEKLTEQKAGELYICRTIRDALKYNTSFSEYKKVDIPCDSQTHNSIDRHMILELNTGQKYNITVSEICGPDFDEED